MRRLFTFIGVLTLLAALAGWAAGPDRRQQACFKVGLCEKPDLLGAMLVSVQRQQKLIVLAARLVQPVTSIRDTTFGPVTVATTRQTSVLPARVDYVVDLSRLGSADLLWDASTRMLTVKRPPVTIQEPTIDWAQAQTYGDKGWATVMTEVSSNLRQDNAEKAPRQFRMQARAPDLVAQADAAADAALTTLFAMPLAAAGYPDARIVISH